MKKKLFELLNAKGYATDTEVAKLYGKEPNWNTVEVYKCEWSRLNRDRNYFSNCKILSVERYKRHIYANTYDGKYKISKAFYDECLKNGIKKDE